MAGKTTWSLQFVRSRLRSLPSLWPKEFLIFIISAWLIILTFAIHLEPHSFDYSNVSGFFGPGAFWAWVIGCLIGFCHNEGRHLLRVIWKEPWVFPLSIDHILDLPPLPTEEKSAERTDVSENDSGQDDVLEKDKMDYITRFLKELMEDTLTDKKDRSSQYIELRLWVLDLHKNNIRFFHGFKNSSDNFILQAECADHILDSLPVFYKERTKYPGFMRVNMFEEESDSILMQRVYRLPENLRAVCPWFELNDTDFIRYLIEFRNRTEFWSYQYDTSKAEIPRNMDVNTWATVLYALVSCWVCLIEHGRFRSKTWRPEDETASCVAQIAFGVSALALLSSHPRMPERYSMARVSLRSFSWMIVYWHSWLVMACRGFFIENEWAIPTVLAFAHLQGLMGLLNLRLMTLERVIWVTRKFSWFTTRPALSKSDMRLGTYLLALLPTIFFGFLGAGKFSNFSKLSWTVRAGPPIPKSSASIADLDQAAALATALVILLDIPLQFIMSLLGQALWDGFVVLVITIGRTIEGTPWLLNTVKAIFPFLGLPDYVIMNPVWAVKKAAGFMQSIFQLSRTGLNHLRDLPRRRHDNNAIELQRRTTGQVEEGVR